MPGVTGRVIAADAFLIRIDLEHGFVMRLAGMVGD